jgi:heat shock protein HtpX
VTRVRVVGVEGGWGSGCRPAWPITWVMRRRRDRVFRASLRVQVIGVICLLAVPLLLAAVAWLLVIVAVWLAIIVGFAFVLGLQVAVAKRWTGRVAKPVSVHDAPEIHAIVERLCATGDLAKPAIVLHDVAYANSWIKGLRSTRTKLHLTKPLVELLDEHQLGAVIAHELAHVGQRDSSLMSAIGSPVAAMQDGAAMYFHTFIRGLRNDALANPLGFYALALAPVGVLFVIVGGACRIITTTFSRARELEADAGSARLTGNPAALASALIALSNSTQQTIPLADLRSAASLDAFHIVALAKEHPLVHTHPTLHRRLAQLATMDSRLHS